MSRSIAPVAAALLSTIAGGAAGGCDSAPSCETVARHVKEIEPGLLDDADVAKAAAECQTRHWSGAMRSCVMKAKGLEDVAACAATEDARANGGRPRRSEAELNLAAIGKAAGYVHAETDAFPQVTAPLTPARPCCEGPGHKCPAVASDWASPAWDALDFELTEPSLFQYSYTSTSPTSYVAQAVGDLDCDGETVSYELRGTVVDGIPRIELIKPTRPD